MKKFIKKTILNVLAAVRPDFGPKVIYYHDVHGGRQHTSMSTPLSLFREHIETAERMGFTFVKGLPKKDRQLMLCFDDGFHGLWECKDYFSEKKLWPTVFIAVSLVGKDGYLNWEEIRELSAMGFEFQSHTWSHQTLAGPMIDESPKAERTDDWYRHELVDAKLELEQRLGTPISSLCFPCGYFSDITIKYSTDAGYKFLYASYPGCVSSETASEGSSVIIPRCLVQDSSVGVFTSVLRGGLIPLQNRYVNQHFFN